MSANYAQWYIDKGFIKPKGVARLKMHGLRRGTAQICCGVWICHLLGGLHIRHKDGLPQTLIRVTHDRREVTCLACRKSTARLTERDDG